MKERKVQTEVLKETLEQGIVNGVKSNGEVIGEFSDKVGKLQ